MRGSAKLLLAGILVAVAAPGMYAQAIRLEDGSLSTSSSVRQQHVELLTSAVQAVAGKPSWVELRFRVAPGFHINSHTPHDELLLPTSFEVTGQSSRVLQQSYPAGVPLHLDVGAGEILSTYQGEFAVRLQLVATPGSPELTGSLRYQACDAHSCFPPRRLPVQVAVAAR